METNPDIIQVACAIRRIFGRRAGPLVEQQAETDDPDAGDFWSRVASVIRELQACESLLVH
jgi:hypothetical protein